MTLRKRKNPTPDFKMPPPFEPMVGEHLDLIPTGLPPYCAMMQVAAEDTHANYVICRGYDPRDNRFYEYDPDDVATKPGIPVAKAYGRRFVGRYRVAEMHPAVIPVTRIGQTPGVPESSPGHPADLDEKIEILWDDAHEKVINWLLLDDGGDLVRFELLEALVQWSGDRVTAARKVWDPTAAEGEGDYVVDCDDTFLVADLNEVGHNAGVNGYGVCEMVVKGDGTPIGSILDLCCPGDEQGTCPGV